MKSLLVILLSTFMLLTSHASAADLYEIKTLVITIPKGNPIKSKSGIYSDEKKRELINKLILIPKFGYHVSPTIHTELNRISEVGTKLIKFTGMKITRENRFFAISGKFQDIKSKVTILFHGNLKLNESLVEIEDNRIIIITLNRSLLKN